MHAYSAYDAAILLTVDRNAEEDGVHQLHCLPWKSNWLWNAGNEFDTG